MPGVGVVGEVLAAPGVLLTLPFHNVMPGGGLGVVALIVVGNGIAYALIAALLRQIVRSN